MYRTVWLWGLLACGGGGDAPLDSDATTSEDSDGPAAFVPECEAPPSSPCGKSAVVRGVVRLDPSLTGVPTSGELFIALSHYQLGGGAAGGFYHNHVTVQVDDITAGEVPFELDMCDGGEMWSEENCDYNLIAILDQNGNQTSTNLVPDPGEPATRVGGIVLSCEGESPCLDVLLDCDGGSDCVAFTDPGACSCDPNSCNSPITTCI